MTSLRVAAGRPARSGWRGPVAAMAAAGALLVSACASSPGDGDVELGGGVPLPQDPPAATGAPGGGGGAGAHGEAGGAPRAPGQTGGRAAPDPALPPGSEAGPVLPAAGGPPGSFAPGYLRPEPADRIVVEIHSQDAAAVRPESLEHLRSRLGQVSGKPVVVEAATAFNDSRRSWSADEVRGAAAALARTPQGEGTAVMRLLLLRGGFEAADVLGASVEGAVMAIFVDEVERAASPLGSSARIERAVVLHEAGHLLGLVDLYLDTGRADPEHPGHSPNEESVMYWAVESTLVSELVGGGPPTEFDQADLRDLAAIAAGA